MEIIMKNPNGENQTSPAFAQVGNAEPATDENPPTPGTADRSADASEGRHAPTQGLYGWITHTELASSDPAATKEWCSAVLGWTFMPSFPMPEGDYHLFAYSDQGGGGIRQVNPPEVPGSVPYVHVADTRAAFANALNDGAEEMLPPTSVMEGVTVAIVRAPGGVPIGFSGP